MFLESLLKADHLSGALIFAPPWASILEPPGLRFGSYFGTPAHPFRRILEVSRDRSASILGACTLPTHPDRDHPSSSNFVGWGVGKGGAGTSAEETLPWHARPTHLATQINKIT